MLASTVDGKGLIVRKCGPTSCDAILFASAEKRDDEMHLSPYHNVRHFQGTSDLSDSGLSRSLLTASDRRRSFDVLAQKSWSDRRNRNWKAPMFLEQACAALGSRVLSVLVWNA